MRIFLFLLLTLLLLMSSCQSDLPTEVKVELSKIDHALDYNFNIKPILSDRCFSCHGPDEQAREASLRLDVEASAKNRDRDGLPAIWPGKHSKSGLAARITSHDAAFRMPPPKSKLTLTPEEQALLVKWIEQGATYKKHWSFIPPLKPDLPAIEDSGFVENEIDLFIMEALRARGLSPSERAGKERLMKRLYMDLTGLPPAIDEIDAFLADEDHDAYEKVVDRLLRSSAAAERLTMEWMDLSRYADSHGLHADGWRRMWPWRDWVINAFIENMPYDQFVTQQLAGDLMPDASREQILATAFHRNHPMTAEGGAIDEEFRLEYVADRTNTTATAMMGLTLECARCHDHKFDPISQKEYYQMTAFFNNVHELGMTGDDGNYGPILQLASKETENLLASLDLEIAEVDSEISSRQEALEQLKSYLNSSTPNAQDDLLVYLPLDRVGVKLLGGQEKTIIDGQEFCTSNGKPKTVEGVKGRAIDFVNEYDELYIHDRGNFDVQDPFSVAVWVNTRKRKETKTQVILGNAGDKNNFWRGWDLYLDDQNRLNLRLIHSLPHNYLHIQTEDSVRLNTWTHLAFSYDGSGSLANTQLFINGQACDVELKYNRLYKNIRTVSSGAHNELNRPLRIGKSYRSFTGDNGIFQGLMDELRIYRKPLSEWEILLLADGANANSERIKLNHAKINDSSVRNLQRRRSELLSKQIAIADTIAEVMVMEEMKSPRPAYVLDRGQYDAKTEEVEPGTPIEVLAFPPDFPKNRLGLAKWLFDPQHPLTARATVNRYWQMVFGQGIVKTARDFGSQGALPSHPQLLDWLARYLIDQKWDLRALLKIMVMSNTYQRSSHATEENMRIDPENVFLARGSSYRYPAEMIRDNALAASGLLVRKVGGPSVKPYQPKGLWIEKGTFSHRLLRYQEGTGEDLYRRSLYTFVKRTSPHPVMTVFDAPNRDVCTVTRESTNTPLQALVLLNDPQFVESAKVLAERVLLAKSELSDQIKLAFRLVSGRAPQSDEVKVLEGTFDRERIKFLNEPTAAEQLLQVGAYRISSSLEQVSVAAMTIVCSTLINHDEAYMKR